MPRSQGRGQTPLSRWIWRMAGSGTSIDSDPALHSGRELGVIVFSYQPEIVHRLQRAFQVIQACLHLLTTGPEALGEAHPFARDARLILRGEWSYELVALRTTGLMAM